MLVIGNLDKSRQGPSSLGTYLPVRNMGSRKCDSSIWNVRSVGNDKFYRKIKRQGHEIIT